jgi:hypothetical protein
MDNSERYKLLYGPYVPPKCRVGDKLPCEYLGRDVTVRRMTDARMQWPATRGGPRPAVIVCADLIRAIRVESAIAVAFHWGVSAATVGNWRRALEVPRITNGTRRLHIDYAPEKLTPEVRAKAKESMHSPETRAKLSAGRVGRPLHPNMVAAQREAVRRPKSDEWKQRLSQRMREMWQHPEEHGLPARHVWTDEENALIGTQSDAAIANLLNVTEAVVYNQRRRLGIARDVQRWTDSEIRLLGSASDGEVGRRLGKSEGAVRRKRLQLKIPSAARRWTAEEIALLGTDTDSQVARKLGRTDSSVQEKRKLLGIPATRLCWTAEENALLGRYSDEDVAMIVGRSVEAVRLRRCRLGIPAF